MRHNAPIHEMAPKELGDLLEKQHADSLGWALTCCSYHRETAEDVLQTVYLKILEGKATFNGYSSFRTWLFSVIRNTASDLKRKKRIKTLGLAALGDLVKQEGDTHHLDPEQSTERSQYNAILLRALSQLPRRQQEVLHLVFYQGQTIQQAGEILKISSGSARTHYERGKTHLRKLLKMWREDQ